MNNKPIATWRDLNEIVATLDEAGCLQLMKEEMEGLRRPAFIRRIHSRLNRVRAARERKELDKTLT